MLLFSRIVSTYDALLFYCRRPPYAAVRRPVFVTKTWRVIIALVDFAGRDQEPLTARHFVVVVEAQYRYTQWQCVRSVIFSHSV